MLSLTVTSPIQNKITIDNSSVVGNINQTISVQDSYTSGSKGHLYNPFDHFHFHDHKIYLLASVYVIVFMIVKLISEKKFNYCCFACYRNCDQEDDETKVSPKQVCQRHRTSAGSIFPESAFLVTVGALPALLLLSSNFAIEKSLDPSFLFNVLLIPIVMSAGWCVDKIVFYRNLGTILLFAIFGTILNAAILAPLFYFGGQSKWGIFSFDMDMLDSGMYSVLICAVDPVAVLSVFESMHIDKLIYNIVFGESLLNDGVAVVFYNAFKEMKSLPDVNFFASIGVIFGFFLYAVVVSVLIAFLMAIIISFTTKLFYQHQPMQIVVLFSMNYLAYIIADTVKGSGILTLFFCVIIQRQYVQANLSHVSQTIITQILSQVSLLSEGVIFILMGMTSFAPTGLATNTDISFSLYLIVICYVSRFVVIFFLGTIANIFRKERLGYKRALFIQAHGGLRGAIGFALALTLGDNFPNKNYYQSATAIMVFFSVYILGATIKPLVRLCKIPIETHKEKTGFSTLQDKICDRTKDAIKTIIGSSSMRFKWESYYRKVNNRYFKKWLMSDNSVERNASNSSVVKTYKMQSIFEAQEIADDYTTIDNESVSQFKTGSKLKMYEIITSSYGSHLGNLRHNIDIEERNKLSELEARPLPHIEEPENQENSDENYAYETIRKSGDEEKNVRFNLTQSNH